MVSACTRFSRRHPAALPLALAGLVFALDGLWSLLVGSTGTIAFALADWPAHLATCLLLLLACAAVRGEPPGPAFVAAALAGAIAIDVDHIPGYLGSHLLTGTLPRPFSHSLATASLLLLTAAAVPARRLRVVLLGLSFGLAAHLLRDLATGPGIDFLWPFSDGAERIPYAAYAVLVVLAAALATAGQRRTLAAVAAAAAAVLVAAAAPPPAPARAGGSVSLGAYIPGAAWNPGAIDAYAKRVRHDPVTVSIYTPWSRAPFRGAELAGIWNRGAVPLVTWEPWTEDGAGFPLEAIAAGAYDRYVRAAARAARAWGKPLLVRFAHEMNGDWYPWGRTRSSPRAYKRAWRHVVGIFRRLHVDNVRWVWSPYVQQKPQLAFMQYFPGTRWVDWVSLDGFNFNNNGKWKSFREIFGTSYQIVKKLPLPIMVGETGTSESPKRKPRWVRNLLGRELPRFRRIRALVWFNDVFNGVDSSVDSSPAALRALRRGARAPRYQLGRRGFLTLSGFRR